jgi:hypothetical protein
VIGLLLITGPERAHASVIGPVPWMIDSSQVGVDKVKPRRPEVHVSLIKRGRDPDLVLGGNEEIYMAEAVFGSVILAVHGEDDRTPPEHLGYHLRLAGGQLPPRFELPEFPMIPHSVRWDSTRTRKPPLQLFLPWHDWMRDQAEHLASLRFGLLITCLDAAGNESVPSDTLWITDPGR